MLFFFGRFCSPFRLTHRANLLGIQERRSILLPGCIGGRHDQLQRQNAAIARRTMECAPDQQPRRHAVLAALGGQEAILESDHQGRCDGTDQSGCYR